VAFNYSTSEVMNFQLRCGFNGKDQLLLHIAGASHNSYRHECALLKHKQ